MRSKAIRFLCLMAINYTNVFIIIYNDLLFRIELVFCLALAPWLCIIRRFRPLIMCYAILGIIVYFNSHIADFLYYFILRVNFTDIVIDNDYMCKSFSYLFSTCVIYIISRSILLEKSGREPKRDGEDGLLKVKSRQA